MKIELREARAHEFPVLERLMQLYLYDFAAIDDWPIADDGRYGNARTIENFWKDPQMTSFIVRLHRRRGVGTEVARRVFDRYPGKWEVTQLTRNVDAQAFWRLVIAAYTGGRYEERPRPDGRGVMQRFDNGRR